MLTMEELEELYCEDYSDQDGGEFKFLSFTPYGGSAKVEAVGDNLARQANDIYKRFGSKTQIRVYR